MTLNVNMTDTIISNQIDPAAVAIQFTAPNIQVTIDTGIAVISGGDNGVANAQNGNTLINNGNIFGFGDGVEFSGDNATITNNAGGSIAGRLNGIDLQGDGATVTNHGTVLGYIFNGILIEAVSDNVVLNNYGEIYGPNDGVVVFSNFGGGIINNSGLIHSNQFGVFVNTAPGLTTVIKNSAGGVIKGTDDAIVTVEGRISLDNRGTIAGIIDCNATTGNVNDVVTNKGKIAGDVFLGPGNDTFNGNGGSATTVFGEIGNDTLIGGKSGDVLNGGAGNDTVRGGRGKDQLFGGTERDLFDFNSIKDSLKGAKRDVINDFVHGNNVTGDDIDLKGIDAKTGVSGNNAFKFIGKSDFHEKKGELRYEDKGAKVIVQGDVNGDGKADFEILVKIGALFAGDFLL